MEVYLITNLINDKKYVGITSVGYKERYKQHKSTAKNEYDKRGKNQSGYPLRLLYSSCMMMVPAAQLFFPYAVMQCSKPP